MPFSSRHTMNFLLITITEIYMFFTLSVYISKLNYSEVNVWTLYYTEINITAHLHSGFCEMCPK